MIAAHPLVFAFYLVAFMLFVAAAFGLPVRQVALGWLGMAFLVLAIGLAPFFTGMQPYWFGRAVRVVPGVLGPVVRVTDVLAAVLISVLLIVVALALSTLAIRDRVTEVFWWLTLAAGVLLLGVALIVLLFPS